MHLGKPRRIAGVGLCIRLYSDTVHAIDATLLMSRLRLRRTRRRFFSRSIAILAGALVSALFDGCPGSSRVSRDCGEEPPLSNNRLVVASAAGQQRMGLRSGRPWLDRPLV